MKTIGIKTEPIAVYKLFSKQLLIHLIVSEYNVGGITDKKVTITNLGDAVLYNCVFKHKTSAGYSTYEVSVLKHNDRYDIFAIGDYVYAGAFSYLNEDISTFPHNRIAHHTPDSKYVCEDTSLDQVEVTKHGN